MKNVSTIELLDSILEGGIHNTNFFNGRLLAAEDLQVEQQANRQHHYQLGQSIGAGVVNGMEVSLIANGSSGMSPTLSIKKGLALNNKGQALYLPDDVEVALVRKSEQTVGEAGLFAECDPPQTTATGTGIYILVIEPATGFKERAPMIGLSGNGKATGCGSRYEVEGVQFRLVGLDVNSIPGVSTTTRSQLKALMTTSGAAAMSKLRNMLAHLCFGTETLDDFPKDPFKRVSGMSPYTTYGVLDALRSINKLTGCDVPLTLIYWTTNGIQFVDMWSVRRRAIPKATSLTWVPLVGQRRLAEAEAAFLQFQEHLADLIESSEDETAASRIRAKDHFELLPPAGFLPLAETGRRGMNYLQFFQGITVRDPRVSAIKAGVGPIFLEGARVATLWRDALSSPPINLSSGIFFWLYRVRENVLFDNDSQQTPQSFILFTSGYLSYYGTPRFDLSRWDRSNYSSVLLGPGEI